MDINHNILYFGKQNTWARKKKYGKMPDNKTKPLMNGSE